MAEQDLFNFDDDTESQSEPPAAPKYSWNWWDPWPDGLTDRQYLILQIARDMRALEEETDPEYEDFYALRILAYREDVKKMDGDQSETPSKPFPAAAPGADG